MQPKTRIVCYHYFGGLVLLLNVVVYKVNAQSFTGYHSSPYAGVYSTITSPADILNYRVRADLNLVSLSTELGNNIFKFSYKNRNDDKGGFSYPDPITKKGKFLGLTDVFGPSLLVKWNDKNAIALTTRARVMANLHGIATDLLNSTVPDFIDPRYIGTPLSISNMSANMHAWKEVALTYSRQVANTDYGVWKAGASLKLLGGFAAVSFTSNNISFIHDSIIDPTDGKKKDAIINTTGNIALSYTKNLDSLGANSSDYLNFSHPSLGLDIGVSYEFRDEMQVYETQYSDKTANYIWKAGASITDIGFVKYNKDGMKGITIASAGKTYTTDQLTVPSDSTEAYQIINYYKNLFNARTEGNTLVMQLPTTLHLTYDRYFNKWLGVQAQVNVPLVFTRLSYYNGNYNPLGLYITPRAEIPQAGFYMPISYNSISGFKVGAALRLGPLVIGSSSVINMRVAKTKAFDGYFILRIPLFSFREYKEKKINDTPRLTKKQRRLLDCPK
ncbi:MAG: hypothetical protein JST86_07395 [Bacteroidetes bacterium]|nr:hypothetical protein [Bacteroidota bacterium]